MTPYDFKRISDRIAAVFAHLLMIAAALFGFYGWFLACTSRSIGAVFSGIAFGLLGGFLAGVLFLRMYSSKVSLGIVHFLLFPVHHLRKPPPVLSPIEGKITAGDFQGAEADLLALRESYSGNVQVAMMLVNLYSLKMHQEPAAFAAGCQYFRSAENSYAQENIRILMRVADLGTRCGGVQLAAAFLQQELASSRYPDVEKKQIAARLAMLQGAAQEE